MCPCRRPPEVSSLGHRAMRRHAANGDCASMTRATGFLTCDAPRATTRAVTRAEVDVSPDEKRHRLGADLPGHAFDAFAATGARPLSAITFVGAATPCYGSTRPSTVAQSLTRVCQVRTSCAKSLQWRKLCRPLTLASAFTYLDWREEV
jgi:hypothetical protein